MPSWLPARPWEGKHQAFPSRCWQGLTRHLGSSQSLPSRPALHWPQESRKEPCPNSVLSLERSGGGAGEADYKSAPEGGLTCFNCPSYPLGPDLFLACTRRSIHVLTDLHGMASDRTFSACRGFPHGGVYRSLGRSDEVMLS